MASHQEAFASGSQILSTYSDIQYMINAINPATNGVS